MEMLFGNTHPPIQKSKVLFVEGRDEEIFFRTLIQVLSLDSSIEVRSYQGRGKFPKELEALVTSSGFDQVTSLGILMDAEDKPAVDTFRSIHSSLNKTNDYLGKNKVLPVFDLPKKEATNPLCAKTDQMKLSVFVLPDCQRSGAFEALMLDHFKTLPEFDCTRKYLECLKQTRQGSVLKNKPSRDDKVLVQAFLASRIDDTWLLPKSALKHGDPLSFATSDAFDPIRKFLKEL